MSEPRILVLFHSTGGATWKMAQAVAAGAAETGAAVTLKQVPEIAEAPTIQGPDFAAKRAPFADVPVAEPSDLLDCDGLALGTPVHFGSMSGALRVFLDRTAKMWFDGALIGKPATVFTGAGSGGGRGKRDPGPVVVARHPRHDPGAARPAQRGGDGPVGSAWRQPARRRHDHPRRRRTAQPGGA